MVTQLVDGILPPMVTPFLDDESVDEAGVRSEARFLLDAGVHGICVGGSTGEGHTLSIEESCRITEIALEEANGSAPVIAGIIRDSTRDVIAYGKALKSIGADALQITPVHYLFTSGDDGTYAYYARIAEAVDLPIVIYNVIPWNTVSPETLMRLAEIDQVKAVKQSGGDIHKLADLLLMNEGRLKIYTAVDDLMYSSFSLGADGAIAAILTVLPAHSVALWNAVQRGDAAEALRLHMQLLPTWRAVGVQDMPARIKAALAMQGRAGGIARHPILPVMPAVRAEIANALGRADISVHAAA